MGNPYQELHGAQVHSIIGGGEPIPFARIPDPFSVKVNGRGELICQAFVNDDGTCRIRLDDDLRPMFWAELHLDLAFVNRWFVLAEEAKRARVAGFIEGEGI